MPLAIYHAKQYDTSIASLLYKNTRTVGCRDKRHHSIDTNTHTHVLTY